MINRGVAAAVGIASAALAMQIPSVPRAMASQSVPFQDPNAAGAITLCGRNDQPVFSGSLLTQPFVWKAVSSTPAPHGFTRAYLALYQPIQNVDPGDWTGYALTDVSVFSNATHPAAQATNLDVPLIDPNNELPAYWDGLYQLRMFFTSPGAPPVTSTYPTAVIKVESKQWSLVSGGSTSCSSGQAVSLASKYSAASANSTPQTILVGPPTTTGSKRSNTIQSTVEASAPITAPSTSSKVTTSSTTDEARAVAAGAIRHSAGGSSTAPWIGLGVAALLLVTASGLLIRRRRRTAV